MVRPIQINGTNFVQNGSKQNTFVYKFPAGAVTIEDGDQIALASFSVSYNFYNITANYNNNRSNYYWFTGAYPYGNFTDTKVEITWPDGFYALYADPNQQYDSYNQYLQKIMIQNKHYLINEYGQYVFYIEWSRNSTYGLSQLVCYPLPTTLPTGWSLPAGATWTLPTAATCPVFEYILGSRQNLLTGFNVGLYPSAYTSTTFSVLGTQEQTFFPKSINLMCSLVKNIYQQPSTLLYGVPLKKYLNGEVVQFILGAYSYCDMQAGMYDSFSIEFLDDLFQPITLNSTNIAVTLVIQKKRDLIQLLRSS